MMNPAAELETLIREAENAERFIPIIADAAGGLPGEPLSSLDAIQAYYASATETGNIVVWLLKAKTLIRVEINPATDCLTIHIPINTITRVLCESTQKTYQITLEISGDRETILTETLPSGANINRVVKTTYLFTEEIGAPTLQTLTSFTRKLIEHVNY